MGYLKSFHKENLGQNATNGQPIVTVVVVVVRVHPIRIEVQVLSVVDIATIERRRPIVAVASNIV